MRGETLLDEVGRREEEEEERPLRSTAQDDCPEHSRRGEHLNRGS